MNTSPIIIIGSGLAGYMLAKEFRQLDKITPLHIITASDGRFYSKPLLSTALTNSKHPDNLAIADAATMATQLDATIQTSTTVSAIKSDENCIVIQQEKINYQKLILACGAETIKLPIKGDANKDILAVNDLTSYIAFHKALNGKKRIVILGAGLVGCEFANDLINVGHEVTVVAPAKFPLDSFLPEKIALLLQQTLTENGVNWHLQQTVDTVNRIKQDYEITLSSGQKLNADVILSAVGLQPNNSLAKQAGIRVNRGINVNRFLETSINNIYALGDCAEVNSLVLLYVAPLLTCARALAKTLAGQATPVSYAAMPIVIKTPACPIVAVPQPRDTEGEWLIMGSDKNLTALFYDKNNQLRGFALTGKATSEKLALQKQLPPMF